MYKAISFDDATDTELKIAAHFSGGEYSTQVSKVLAALKLDAAQRATLVDHLQFVGYHSIRVNMASRPTSYTGNNTQCVLAWPSQHSADHCNRVQAFLATLGFKDLMNVPRYGSPLMIFTSATQWHHAGQLLAKQNVRISGVRFSPDSRADKLWDMRAQKHFREEVLRVMERGRQVGFLTIRKYEGLDKIHVELQNTR
jgi:hypothetical protein